MAGFTNWIYTKKSDERDNAIKALEKAKLLEEKRNTKKGIKVNSNIILILLISNLLLASCGQSTSQNKVSQKRIKLKEETNVNGSLYLIIEVDSIEYLSNYHGGMIRITK